MEKISLTEKINKAKEATKNTIKKGADEAVKLGKWVNENKTDLLALGAFAVGGYKFLENLKPKKTAKERDYEDREMRFYDSNNNVWYDLKRPLKTSEKLEIAEMRTKGYSVGNILRQMGILKYY